MFVNPPPKIGEFRGGVDNFSHHIAQSISACGVILRGPLEVPRVKIFNFFLGIFQRVSKVSKSIFWASYYHVVAQKSIFWTNISKKVVNTIPPPG